MSSEQSEESLTYDEVNSWRSDALKLYCRQRGLKVSGSKQELVTCVFASSEMGIPVQATAEERIATTTNEKARLLDLGNGSSLPDPSTLKDWLRESDAITSWPPIFLNDIILFLIEDHPGKDVALHERVLNEYKDGKAYRLYESGWLKEIYWHPVSTASEFCFLKASCAHTMKIRDTPHIAWIAADKKCGKIVSAYCNVWLGK